MGFGSDLRVYDLWLGVMGLGFGFTSLDFIVIDGLRFGFKSIGFQIENWGFGFKTLEFMVMNYGLGVWI